MMVFLGSPFLFQGICCTAIYAAGQDSISIVWGIFMFVNICCLLPAELKIRKSTKKNKAGENYKKDDGEETSSSIQKKDPAEMNEEELQAWRIELQEIDARERANDTSEAVASVGRVWGSVWLYTAMLTLIPASMVVSTEVSGDLAAGGIFIYVVLLWSGGWVYMWFHADALDAIEPEQRYGLT